MPTLALVVNEPPPYRIPVFNRIAATPGLRLRVIFCCRREPNRQWDLPPFAFDHVFLRESIRTVRGRYIHNNPEVWKVLSQFEPDVVIGNGFNPTHLYTMAWCASHRRPYVPMTDGTLKSERGLSQFHRAIRRYTYRHARALIAASDGGFALYQSYRTPHAACFRSCLCTDNTRFRPAERMAEPINDFIFCGRLEPGKRPEFAIEVAARCADLLMSKTRLLFVGAGSMEPHLKSLATLYADKVQVAFNGFAAQCDLPALYQSAKIFLFPTEADVWGVVANEACAAGLPVIVSPHAGVADELVVDGKNGFVRELERESWADAAATLLSNDALRAAYGQRSRMMVEPYNFDQAAQGIIDAAEAALAAPSPRYQAVRRPV
jgi:glycosyltransferase involved in cell wall biosynthesis